jgi:hypothetical protein
MRPNLSLLALLVLLGCATNQPPSGPSLGPPPRPTSATSVCMESAISTLKKAKLRFEDSRSDGDKCVAARETMEIGKRFLAQPLGVVIASGNTVIGAIGSDHRPTTYENPCPNDSGPTAFNAFSGHTYALESVDLATCPAPFRAAFHEYTSGWRNLRQMTDRSRGLPLQAVQRVIAAGVARDPTEQMVLREADRIERSTIAIRRTFQVETGWCHDTRSEVDVIYWRGCPRL